MPLFSMVTPYEFRWTRYIVQIYDGPRATIRATVPAPM